MGGLRDQLKKAKILSEKEARRLAHEERVRRKEVGREGLEQEEKARQAELAKQRDQERERSRATQQEVEAQRRLAAEVAACQDILERDMVRPRGSGARWYFQLADGRLPYFEVDESLRFQLQSGAFWIVCRGVVESHAYGLLPADLAKRVAATLPEVFAWAPGGEAAIAAAACSA
ncbi:MAG: DUF2058 family protein [Planctomycetota bacterium]